MFNLQNVFHIRLTSILSSDWPKLLGTSSWSPNNNWICCSNDSPTTCSISRTGLCSCSSPAPYCSSGDCSSRLDHPACNSSPCSPACPSTACFCGCSPSTCTCPCTSAGSAAGPAGADQHGRSWRRFYWATGRAGTYKSLTGNNSKSTRYSL